MTYDDVMTLLDDFETGAIEYKYSPEDIDKAIDLVIMLARNGVLPNEDPDEMERDIQELLYGEEDSFVPAFFYGKGDIILCKNRFVKSCQKAGKFIKKKKKAIIIGAAVVVAVVTVVGIAAAVTAAAAGVAEAAADNHTSSKSNTPTPSPAASDSSSSLYTQIEGPTVSFKENVANEQFFEPSFQKETFKEKGRVLGSLFAHETFQQFSQPNFAFPKEHEAIDRKFTTDYTSLYSSSNKEHDFNTLAYQLQGERELSSGHLKQAVYDFSQAIERNPASPLPYLERGVAHFGLGEYDRSLEDYHQYNTQAAKTEPLSVPAFSLGFAKSLPKGIYESGKGLALFISDIVVHPIRTGDQVWESLKLLSNLAKSQEWNTLSEMLAPEVHQLVQEWDNLDSEVRGKLAGYAFGKYGADILIPGALAKGVSKGAKGAQELGAVYKTLQNAEKALLLESAAELGSGGKIGEALHKTYNTAMLGEELGFSVKEINQLKQAGQLERTFEHIANNPALRESAEKFANAKKALKPHTKQFMPEAKVRELIHETGIPTFPRPEGIPENFLVRISEKGAGIEYVNPVNEHISVRVMPAQIHSQFPCQQKNYVVQMREGKAVDKLGNRISSKTPDAHIPLEEFLYKD